MRKKDADGALRVSPTDAAALGIATGDTATLSTIRGETTVVVEVSEQMQPGPISLPNGLGLDNADDRTTGRTGVAINDLTSSEDRDWFAGTPWHKSVPANLAAR